tara:strand:- start:910 stop:1872 length:963 start_codon:yes stop_codon:yes gene_type:complete
MKYAVKKQLPEYNAKIGELLDKEASSLKKINFIYTSSYISLLFLGAFFVDLGGFLKPQTRIMAGIICTIGAFSIYTLKNRKNLTERWTHTRVISETIKSEWFKFVVGGGDYPIKSKNQEEYYIKFLNSNITKFYDEYRSKIESNGDQHVYLENFKLDEYSLTMRKKSLAERLDYYKIHRIEDQKNWYDMKSKKMKRNLRVFKFLFQGIVGLGAIIGIYMWLNIFNSWDISFLEDSDFFSIAVALAFAFDAFSSINQYERLSIAYNRSFEELAESIREIIDPDNDISTSEEVFNDFVEDIENKISIEHKSWSLTTSTKNIH